MRYTTNIPLARDQLIDIADEMVKEKDPTPLDLEAWAWRIKDITEDLMTRRPTGRHARKKAAPVSAETRSKAINLLTSTNKSQLEIANKLNVNPGRIAEIWMEHLRGRGEI